MASDEVQSTDEATPFVKELAANDRPTRSAALHSLSTYLSSPRPNLTPIVLLKIHSALFYNLWLTDRPVPQQRVASSLAALVLVLPKSGIVPFLRAFWQTIQREWTRIDVLRMEKFLLLVRRYLGVMVEVGRRGGWEEEEVRGLMGVLKEGPFLVGDGEMKVPVGVRFHVLDVWVDELARVGGEELGFVQEEDEDEEDDEEKDVAEKQDHDESNLQKQRLSWFLAPIEAVAKSSPTKAVRLRAKDVLADARLPQNRARKTEGQSEEIAGLVEQHAADARPSKKRRVERDGDDKATEVTEVLDKEEEEEEQEEDSWSGIEE